MSSSSNKNSIIGFALIGIILLIFSWYNTKQAKKQQEERFKLDSIAAVAALEHSLADTIDIEELPIDSTSASEYLQMYQSENLAAASIAQNELYTLENEHLKVTIASKGAQPYEVLIKNYYTFDSLALNLVRPGKSTFDLEINADQWINTSELNYSLVDATDSTLALRLYFDENSYIESVYALAKGSYMVDYNVRFVGMSDILDRRTNQIGLDWTLDVPRLEKGYTNEKNYSTLDYKYSGSTTVKSLGLRKGSASETFTTGLRWFAFQQQYFSALLVAENDFAGGTLSNNFYAEGDTSNSLMNSSAKMMVNIDTRSDDYNMPFKFYFGPNHFPTLKSYDEQFERIIPLGGKLISWINRFVIIPVFNWLSKYFASYGLIILILTLIIKIGLSPLTLKSYSSSAKMKLLRPEIEKINARYPKPDDAMKKQQATMDLYKRAGVSMFGGCLPSLLQFPILFAMFRFFPASFELRQQGFLWASDLSTYDSILNFGFKIPLYGDHISLFALIMGVSMFFYSKMTMQQTPTDPNMKSMAFMQKWFMPIFMVVICNNFSSGLSYYYTLSNLITMLQNWIIGKWFVDEDKLMAKLNANANEPPKKSKFQQRLDAAYKAQQEQLKNQKKR